MQFKNLQDLGLDYSDLAGLQEGTKLKSDAELKDFFFAYHSKDYEWNLHQYDSEKELKEGMEESYSENDYETTIELVVCNGKKVEWDIETIVTFNPYI